MGRMTVTLAVSPSSLGPHPSLMSYKIPIGLTTYAGAEVTSESSWITIGRWLDGVASSQIWRQEARSFSAWLSAQAERLGLGDASLWRFLTAARNLEVIRGDLAMHLGEKSEVPGIAEMVSPESIELACKIRRFAPVDELLPLFALLLQGEVSRADLRRIWARYRDMEGKKQPRAIDTPLRPPPFISQQSVDGAPTAAKEMGPTWFADLAHVFGASANPRISREFHNPRLVGSARSAAPLADRVLVTQDAEGDPLRLHALFDLKRSGRKQLIGRIQTALPYVDAVWLIQYERLRETIWKGIAPLAQVGVVSVEIDQNASGVVRALRVPCPASSEEASIKAVALQSLLAAALIDEPLGSGVPRKSGAIQQAGSRGAELPATSSRSVLPAGRAKHVQLVEALVPKDVAA